MNNKKSQHPHYSNDDSLGNVASSSDMTGLEPTPPQTESEAESYSALAHVPPPENSIKLRDKREKR